MPADFPLQSVPLFSQLSEEETASISRATRNRTYPKNSVIVFEDDPGDALFVVKSGQVKVVLIGEDGREVILSVLRGGNFFGEMSLIDNQPRMASARTTADTELAIVSQDGLKGRLDRLEDADRVLRRLIDVFVQRLRGQARTAE